MQFLFANIRTDHVICPRISQSMIPEIVKWCDNIKNDTIIYYQPTTVAINPSTFAPEINRFDPGIKIVCPDKNILNMFILRWG